MPRRPKPSRLRLLDGARQRDLNPAEPIPRSGKIETPEHLSDSVRVIFEATVEELEHMGIDAPSDRDALAAYAEAVDNHRKASMLLAKSPMLVQGQKGNLVRNPALMIQRDAAHLIRQYAQEFGLTPSARARINSDKQYVDDGNPFAVG
jgi:P27 family predicted phage terminase small subunit